MGESAKVIIPRRHRAGASMIDFMAEEAAQSGLIPLRIKCPECSRVYTLYITDFDQGLHVLLGQACPYCKRFIKESDDPDKLLIDAKPIRGSLKEDKK